MARAPDITKSTRKFVEYHLGKGIFAPLTGQDWPAWNAFVHLVQCYAHGGGDKAIDAMAFTLQCAQVKTWNVFVQAIPAIMDWSTVGVLWPELIRSTGSFLSQPMRKEYSVMCATERCELSNGEVVLREHGAGITGRVGCEVAS